MATATIEPEIPHVHLAMLEILRSLSVDKNGDLPPNMGGKPYITAVDVSKETKTLFVQHGLVIEPVERMVKHEVIPFKERLNIVVVIEGSYRIISTVDGSVAELAGIGDGLATNTAVASNIASTNALKNALLRTFLITEQSVEDAAKNGVDGAQPATPKPVANATRGSATKPVQDGDGKVAELREQIKARVKEIKEETGVDVKYAKIGSRLYPKDPSWANKITPLRAVLKAVEAGETE